jgi:hypothetical protein
MQTSGIRSVLQTIAQQLLTGPALLSSILYVQEKATCVILLTRDRRWEGARYRAVDGVTAFWRHIFIQICSSVVIVTFIISFAFSLLFSQQE